LAAEDQDRSASRIAGNAWRSVARALVSMPLIFASSLLLLEGIECTFATLAPEAIAAPTSRSQIAVFVAVTLSLLLAKESVEAFVLAPIAVAVHRYILLGDTTRGIVSLRTPHTQLFAAWLIALQIASYLFVLPAYLISNSPALLILVVLGLIIPSVIVGVRLSLVFPAIAIDAPLHGVASRAAASWRQTRRRFWLIVGSGILAALPLVLIQLVVIFAKTDVFAGSSSWLSILADGLYAWSVTVVGVAVISWVYHFFVTERRQEAAATTV
jgi:hypothetical protein